MKLARDHNYEDSATLENKIPELQLKEEEKKNPIVGKQRQITIIASLQI